MVYEIEIKNGVLRMNCLGGIFGANIEDFDVIMARVIDRLITDRKVHTIILTETRDSEYDTEQTKMLVEIADAIREILKERKLVSVKRMGPKCDKYRSAWYSWLYNMAAFQMRGDPIGAYVSLLRQIRHIEILEKKGEDPECMRAYLNNILVPIREILEDTALISKAKPFLAGHKIGDRSIYRRFLHPLTRPSFMFTKFVTKPPKGDLLTKYNIGDIRVEIYRVPGKVRPVYFVTPPEFRLTEQEYTLLDDARRVLEKRRPHELEMRDQARMRELFKSISEELIRDLADVRRFKLTSKQIHDLATILTRYTAGLGIIEPLLADPRIEDVNLNSPLGMQPLYVYHRNYDECETNLVPTMMDGDRLATRFKLLSGRPLDEANPVLDTEIIVPGGIARVAAIGPRLSPEGLAFALRKHRFKPWTFPLYLDVGFFNPLFGGLLWFMASYGRTLLVAGTRGAGKTSLLGSIMLQVIPYYRIITVEDSVVGDSEIVIERNGSIERTTVGELIDEQISRYGSTPSLSGHEILDKNKENIRVFSMGSDGKIGLTTVDSFIRHKVDKKIFEIRTRTGRKIRVTTDHSLFTISHDGSIAPVRAGELSVGKYLAVPRALNISGKQKDCINLVNYLHLLDGLYVLGEPVHDLIKQHWGDIKTLAKEQKYSRSIPSAWKRRGILPCGIAAKLMKKTSIRPEGVWIKGLRQSKPIPAKIFLDNDFLEFVGMWLADGCYDRSSVIISATDTETRKMVRRVAKKLGLRARLHSDKWSLMLNSLVLKRIMMEVLELKGNAYTKRIPGWVYGLSKSQKAAVLRGLFSGDGHVSKTELIIALSSEKMIKDIQTLLLGFGVLCNVSRLNERDKTYRCTTGSIRFLRPFAAEIGFLQHAKNSALKSLCARVSTHDTLDVVPLPLELKQRLPPLFGTRRQDYITRNNNIGRERLRYFVQKTPVDGGGAIMQRLSMLADSDLFWDRIVEIKCTEGGDYVYDFSVFGKENFVCENIIAHNTFELPVEALRRLGYNIERLKSRSVITRVELELPAEEVLRTALRLGDSCLFIGEVRSVEAKALYEAMRIGALANVVAGTIHGESAYGVFDRVVNDLGVPPTSFKATDLVVICNKLRTADGLRTFRRVTAVTEVRKHWMHDPVEEHGFLNLLEYSSREDSLKPTDTLLNGESFVLNQVAKNVPGWAGRWDAVWDNILLRGKILETIKDIANQTGKRDLMEAETTVAANQMFHALSEKSRLEVGEVDSKYVYDEWLKWFKGVAKRA
ncbi:MAG: ATPase, T2SS/T4P/T4SS family [Candidatus Aenigmatarchaeota archaeon]